MDPDVMLCLAETIAWCSRFATPEDAESSTRSPKLCPPVMGLPHDQPLRRLLEGSREPKLAVDFVCKARRAELWQLGIPILPVGEDLASGRILFTKIDTDSCDAASVPSNGYYDLNDLPGWDTWFCHRPTEDRWGAIYCWVPECLIDLAQHGMATIPVQSVEWASSLDWLID